MISFNFRGEKPRIHVSSFRRNCRSETRNELAPAGPEVAHGSFRVPNSVSNVFDEPDAQVGRDVSVPEHQRVACAVFACAILLLERAAFNEISDVSVDCVLRALLGWR